MWAMLPACANIGRPSGGERDTQGPQMIGAVPFPGTLNFNSNQVVFYFDEFIKPGSYQKEVFISPVLEKDPEIIVKNKTLKIMFSSPLRDSTTYVVTLGTGIVDFNEGNKMEKSVLYAFSTGDVLDSLRFSGQVSDLWTGQGEKDMKILLFPAEEVEGNNIQGLRPEYATVSDKNGNFDFQFLAPGRYKIYGVGDEDGDFRYSGEREAVGLAADPVVDLQADDTVQRNVGLVSFRQDAEGPVVKSAKWANDFTIHLEFGEAIRTSYLGDSLSVEISDSASGRRLPVTSSRFRNRDQRHLYLHSPLPRASNLDVHLIHFMDSLGNQADTIVRVMKESQVKEETGRWFESPVNLPHAHDFKIPALFLLSSGIDSSLFQLQDTSGAYQPSEIEVVGFHVLVKPTRLLDPSKPYRCELRKGIAKPDGSLTDTLVRMRIMFPDPDGFGTVAGKVLPDSTRPEARFAAIFRGFPGSGYLVEPPAQGAAVGKGRGAGDAKASPAATFEKRFEAPGTFNFVFLKPGEYSLDLIEDEDRNGVMTPGSLNPYRLPEKVYHQSGKFDVKAKWDIKEVEVYPIPPAGKPKGGGLRGGIGDANAESPPGAKDEIKK
jgi:uncharacterized protein (DUF2141 family)